MAPIVGHVGDAKYPPGFEQLQYVQRVVN